MENRQAEFERLFTDYLEGALTQENRQRLYQLIATGEFDEMVEDRMLAEIKEEIKRPDSHAEAARLDYIYENKMKPVMTSVGTEPYGGRQPASLFRRRWWVAAASAAGVVLAFGLGQYYISKEPDVLHAGMDAAAIRTETAVEEVLQTQIRLYDKQFVHLPDGSTVVLNDGAELFYDTDAFKQGARSVYLTGEAFFDIKPKPGQSFIVHSGSVQTTVLGTAFNVKANPAKGEVKVTVSRGKVRVGSQARTYELLSPDEELTVNTKEETFVKTQTKSTIATEWTDGFVIFDDVKLETAARELEKRFGVTIVFGNEKLKKCYVTASFLNGEELDHILQILSPIHHFDYSFSERGTDILLFGDGLCD